jgi:hypothetical protein
MDNFQSFVTEDHVLRKERQDKGHRGRGGSISADGPGKRGPAYRMAAVHSARNAGFHSACTKREGES